MLLVTVGQALDFFSMDGILCQQLRLPVVVEICSIVCCTEPLTLPTVCHVVMDDPGTLKNVNNQYRRFVQFKHRILIGRLTNFVEKL